MTDPTFQLIRLLPWWDPDTVTVSLRGPESEDDAPGLVVRAGLYANPETFWLNDEDD